MDIRGLQYFISAAECLNFTRAARECYITQTAMSLHIAKMEKELGFQLFSRKNHVVRLTPAGKDFYERSKRIVRSYEEAVQHGLDTASGSESGVSIIVPSSFEGLAVMPALNEFKRLHTANGISPRIVESRAIPEALRQGEADLAICWPYDTMGDSDFEVIDIIRCTCCAVVNVHNPMASVPAVTAEMMQNERFAVVEPMGSPSDYREMRSRFDRAGFVPKHKTVAHSSEEVMLMAAADEAVGILPAYMADFAYPDVVFKDFDLPETTSIMGTTSLVYLSGQANPVVRELIDVVIGHFLGHNRVPFASGDAPSGAIVDVEAK